MKHFTKISLRPWGGFIPALTLLLLLAVACGSAAPADTQPADTSGEQQPTPVMVAAATATSVPQVAADPAEVQVHPGKVSIMLGDLAGERFDDIYTPGATGAGNYLRIMGGYLISDNERREMVPGIASHWALSDDGLTWTFTIREGVKFHDGSEVTPEDVHWSLLHYYGPQANDYLVLPSRFSEHSDKIEVSGPDEVMWVFKRPFVEIAFQFSEASGSWKHIMPNRAELNDEDAALSYDNNPIGAGFMRVVSHTQGEVMSFERFDDFYYQPDNGFPEDKRVNFQSLDLFLVPEEATRVAALRAGQADIVPASLPTRAQVEAGGGRMVFGQEGIITDVRVLGCWEPQYPCHDKRVRQALQYAIDRELIQDQLYGGPEVFQIRGWARFTPSSNGYTPELDDASPFDPDKARQLLADAGYPGGQGFGKLIVNTYPSTALPFLVEAAQLAAEFWKRELGLDVEVRVGDRTATKKAKRDGELDGQIEWGDNETRKDLTGNMQSWYGDRRITKSLNSLHDDPELFGPVHQAVEILDAAKREEAIRKLGPRLAEENYQLNIGYINIPWGVGPRILTWEPYPMATYPSALHTITLK